MKKLGPKEGRTIEVGGARLTWKARGEDTGYTNSIYEMDLPNAPLSPDKEPTEAEAEHCLELLKDVMSVQMYFPQSKAESGLAIFQELASRNTQGSLELTDHLLAQYR